MSRPSHRLARFAVLVLVLGLSAGSVGCRPHTAVDRAQSSYEGGDYQDAVDRLNDAEGTYASGELPPDYELRYLAYRGLAYYKLAKETNNKGFRRKGRPFVRRALERWKASEQAQAEGWLDPEIVAELEAESKDAGTGGDGGDAESEAAAAPAKGAAKKP